MNRSVLLGAVLSAALAGSFAAGPAYANHTLCSNGDGGETPDPLHLGVGVDYDESNAVYVCAGNLLVVVRTNGGPVTICLSDDPAHPTSGYCTVIP